MEIKINESPANGIVFISGGSENLAEMTWIKDNEEYIIIDHTMVSDSLKGQGIGRKLLEKIIELAREREIKIQPLCPFVKTMFDRVPEFADVQYIKS